MNTTFVSAGLIPYIELPDSRFIHPFGILVATGVLIGTALTMRRARSIGYDVAKLNSFITWMLVAGFLGGHILDEIFYHWDEVVADPLVLVKLWQGLSSFGGFVGALTGILMWKYFEVRNGGIRRRAKPEFILPFADLVLSVFPIAWIFGRSGCASVHDHPGMRTTADSLLAVSWKTGRPGEEVTTLFGFIKLIHGKVYQFDLGLLEAMFSVIIAFFFVLTWRRRLATGTYVIATALAYAPVRFAMDFLRLPDAEHGDIRYGNLTPAQWACIALFAFGFVMIGVVLRNKKLGRDPGFLIRKAA